MQDLINELWTLSEEQLQKVEEYIKQLKKPKENKHRSLNANSYAWVLIQNIADITNSTKEEVYKKYIKEKGVFRPITVNNEAVNTITKIWQEKGLGWVYDIIHKGVSTTDLALYYGSSSYNTKQMAIFIDYIVDDAKELGIETLTSDELKNLIDDWGNK